MSNTCCTTSESTVPTASLTRYVITPCSVETLTALWTPWPQNNSPERTVERTLPQTPPQTRPPDQAMSLPRLLPPLTAKMVKPVTVARQVTPIL